MVRKDAAAPALLKMKINYGVCENLCVPAQGDAELALTGERSGEDTVLAGGEARVPKQAALGDNAPFAIRAVQREHGKPDRMVVDVAAPPGASVDLFRKHHGHQSRRPPAQCHVPRDDSRRPGAEDHR